ncbi:hypothetical protein ILUMI_14784 [Ignelater luminosus]|uniref:Uncharacterized protein n=1 Tax=Ignelater luminosus TaxID=2038154 RepID=A0A8K0G9Q6_IGNLU|nr:hypothetical protein ILUMI_14784 [Ignelater luminosus]
MDMERIQKVFISRQENMTQINRKLDNITTEMNQLRNENIKLKDQVSKQDDRIEKLEREVRKKITIVRGINEGKEERNGEIKGEIRKVMKTLKVDRREKN